MTGDHRVEALRATLARTRPALDDLTRARVAARIEAAIATSAPAHASGRWWKNGKAVALLGVAMATSSAASAMTALALAPSSGSLGPALAILRRVGPVPDPPAPGLGSSPTSVASVHGRSIAVSVAVGVAVGDPRDTIIIDAPPVAAAVERDGQPRSMGPDIAVSERVEVGESRMVVRGAAVRSTHTTFGAGRDRARVRVIRGEDSIADDAAVTQDLAQEPAASPPVPSVESLYEEAERRMRARDPGAGAVLEQIIAEHTHAREAASALLDRARLAVSAGVPHEALRWLDRLERRNDAEDLVEPATYLRCATLIAMRDHRADACAERFLGRFAGSPRAVALAAHLIARRGQAGDCEGVLALADTYRAILTGGLGDQVRAWRQRCAR